MDGPDTDVVAVVARVRKWAEDDHREDVLTVLDFLAMQSKLIVALGDICRDQAKKLAMPKE